MLYKYYKSLYLLFSTILAPLFIIRNNLNSDTNLHSGN